MVTQPVVENRKSRIFDRKRNGGSYIRAVGSWASCARPVEVAPSHHRRRRRRWRSRERDRENISGKLGTASGSCARDDVTAAPGDLELEPRRGRAKLHAGKPYPFCQSAERQAHRGNRSQRATWITLITITQRDASDRSGTQHPPLTMSPSATNTPQSCYTYGPVNCRCSRQIVGTLIAVDGRVFA